MKAWTARYPVWSVVALGLLTAVLLFRIGDLQGHYEMEDFFPGDSPERQQLEAVWENFGRDDRNALLIIDTNRQLGLQDFRVLEALTQRLETITDLEKVVSPSNTAIVVDDPIDGPTFQPAFDKAKHGSGRVATVLEMFAKPPYRNTLISADQTIAVVTAVLKP